MAPNDTKEEKSIKRVVLFIVVFTSFLSPFMGASVNIALPTISKEFGMQAVSMSWISMGFTLTSAIFMVPLSKLADIIGRKKIFLIGNIIFTLSTAVCMLAVSGESLIIARAFQGLGSAMFYSTGMAILTSVFPIKERGKAIGYTVSAVYLGLSAAPVIGGFLTQYLGWRSLFAVVLPFCLFVIFSTLKTLKSEWIDAQDDKLDLVSSAVFMLSISLLMYGFSKLPDSHAIILAVAGLIGVIVFVIMEFRAKYPILNMHLFKENRVFAFSNLAAFINYAATYAVSFILSLYLQYVKGYQPQQAGLVLIAQPILMMLVSTVSGRLSDKYDSRILSSWGMSIIVIGLLMMIFVDQNTHISYLTVGLLILGTGFGLFSSPNTNAVMSSVDKRFLGTASATIGTMRLTGQMMSMGISTMIIHMFLGNAKLTHENSLTFLSSAKVMFVVFTVLCFAGIFASLARGKKVIINQ